MPRMTDRDKLAELEERQRKLGEEVQAARQSVRGRYANMVTGLAVEEWTEREFRDLLEQGLRTGAPAAIAALRSLPSSR